MQIDDLRNSPLPFSHLKFSFDGKELLAVAERHVYVLDAYDGKLKQKFSNNIPESGTQPEASFSYDGQYVLSGMAFHPWHYVGIIGCGASQDEHACFMFMLQLCPCLLHWYPHSYLHVCGCLMMLLANHPGTPALLYTLLRASLNLGQIYPIVDK